MLSRQPHIFFSLFSIFLFSINHFMNIGKFKQYISFSYSVEKFCHIWGIFWRPYPHVNQTYFSVFFRPISFLCFPMRSIIQPLYIFLSRPSKRAFSQIFSYQNDKQFSRSIFGRAELSVGFRSGFTTRLPFYTLKISFMFELSSTTFSWLETLNDWSVCPNKLWMRVLFLKMSSQ